MPTAPIPSPLKDYVEDKIKMLKKHFKMNLSFMEIAHFHSLENETQVDNYAHDLIMKKL